MKKATIIGLGHIGGSIGLALQEIYPTISVTGVDANPENAKSALERGLVHSITDLAEGVSLGYFIIVATPVNALLEVIPNVLDLIGPDQIVIDVGSTKQELLQSIKDHPMRSRFVATHPMAGKEHSGPQAAELGLFNGKCTVLCETGANNPETIECVEKMYRQLGMRVIYMDAQAHDLHAAYVSHISHISSFALALTVLAKEKDEKSIFNMASGGFSSTVRLAKSSPDMWVPIFKQNRDNVLDVLDEHINTLARFRSLLIKKDFNTFYKLIEHANHIRKILK